MCPRTVPWRGFIARVSHLVESILDLLQLFPSCDPFKSGPGRGLPLNDFSG